MTVGNSEKAYSCWYIENPVCKELCKSLTLRIGASSSQEFILVIKAPHKLHEANLTSFVKVKLLTHSYEEGKGKKQHAKKMSDLPEAEEKERFELNTMVVGRLENPNLKCMRSMFNHDLQEHVIPLAIKKSGGSQKFRIPFKDVSNVTEADIDFNFIKVNNTTEDQSVLECLEFFCMPNNLKLTGNTQGVLNVMVKLNAQKMAELDPKVLK